MTSVRRNIWHLGTAQDPWHPITLSYALGVRAMQQLPITDSRSWAYQAAIHGTHQPDKPAGAPWNECQHATWYFLPWHRMYLFHFENILRSLLPTQRRADFALPFWDYSSGAPGNALPVAFRVPTMPDGSPNPLFVPQRRAAVNAGAALPDVVTSTASALAKTSFTAAPLGGDPGFGGPRTGFAHQGPAFGELEAQPHGPIHVIVGGNTGLMTDPDTAAQDPIFWLHHANIDRLWEVWTINGGTNPVLKVWLDRSFRLRAADRSSARMKTRDVLDTVGGLDYTYESLPVRAGAAGGGRTVPPKKPQPLLIGTNADPVEVSRAGASTSIAVTPLPEPLAAAADPSRLYLNVADIEGDRNPGIVYGVYLNLPAEAGAVTRADHLAGLVSFFGIEQTGPATRGGGHGMRYSFDVTELVDRLRAAGAWEPDRLSVSLLPASDELEPEPEPVAAGAQTPVRVGTFSLYQG